jgi:DNA repair exonuclease SbcCD nuclease subunit
MKIAILSDFHIGYERFIEDAFVQAEEALGKASKIADMLVIPGDIFDMRNPKPEVLAQGINLFRNLSKKDWGAKVVSYTGSKRIYTNIPVIAISGTHERRAQDAEDPVELLSLAGLLVNASDANVEVIKDDERIMVFGLGGLSEEKVREVLSKLNPRPSAGAFNIFLFHQSVYELSPFSNDFIHLDELPEGFDLYIDGHIHNKIESKVHNKPFLIPGSTVLTQLKDSEQEAKGFYLFDTNTKTHSYINIKSRNFFVAKIKINGKDLEQIQKEVAKSIDAIILKSEEKPIIRIALEGELKYGYKPTDIDVLGLAKKYEDRAIIEINRANVEDKEAEAEMDSLRKGAFENMSIKDFGLGVFLEKLKSSKYSLSKNPTELFEMLSSDQKKEKVITEALEELFK